MKKTFSSIIISSILLAQPAVSQVVRQWALIGTDGLTQTYADVNSIKGQGSYKIFWVRDEDNSRVVSLNKLYVDCVLNKIGVLTQVRYGSTGDVVGRYSSYVENYPDILKEPLPDSKGEVIMDYVCQRATSHPEKQNQLPKLQLESTGEAVILLQQRLQKLGFSKEPPTGYFGEVTKDAVVRFQRSRRLYPDGVVGQQTWQELMKQ